MSKEKDWPLLIGMLDWDATSIVFTKRSLIEFLKYTGTTVDPNFSNIGKLPRYASFGKLVTVSSTAESPADENLSAVSDAFKPSRRVRTVPGGPHTDIFAQGDEGDALSLAPPKPETVVEATSSAHNQISSQEEEEEQSGINFTSTVKPSRRVRTNPGGNSSMSNFWDSEQQEEFKPTRRVRQRPGGDDHIDGIF